VDDKLLGRPTGLLGLLSTTAAIWTVGAGLVAAMITVISWGAGVSNRIDNLQASMATLTTQIAAVNADSRLHTLEDEERYDSSNVAADMLAVTNREQAQDNAVNGLKGDLGGLANQLTGINTTLNLILNHTVTLNPGVSK
jgi:hypothetical protein